METSVKQIAAWVRAELSATQRRFGGKEPLYAFIEQTYGISRFTVRNFHNGQKDNPTQNMLDGLREALLDMRSVQRFGGVKQGG